MTSRGEVVSSVLTFLSSNKTLRKKAIKTAYKHGDRLYPIVQSIQAAASGAYMLNNTLNGTLNGTTPLTMAQLRESADLTKKTVGDVVAVATDVARELGALVTPTMNFLTNSGADSAVLFSSFGSIAAAGGIAFVAVKVLQGEAALERIAQSLDGIHAAQQAQVALTAQRDFPAHVHEMVHERVMQTSADPDMDHWFFVWHPDNDWHPGFFRKLEERPIGPAFCGYTHQLDTAFAFMRAARRRIAAKEAQARSRGKGRKPVRLHLLIPAYRHILILDPVRVPDDIGDFVMEGRIHDNRYLVVFNLPADHASRYTRDVGTYRTPPREQNIIERVVEVVMGADAPPPPDYRTLGGGDLPPDGDNNHHDDADAAPPRTKEEAAALALRRATPRREDRRSSFSGPDAPHRKDDVVVRETKRMHRNRSRRASVEVGH
ncbi:hypothetical protein RB596_008012 [Gaeumannomyces avenae]